MSLSRSYHRTRLLTLITEKNISNSIVNEIMLLFGNIKTHSEKELVAERCIPLVKNCKTEQEALEAVKKVVEQM